MVNVRTTADHRHRQPNIHNKVSLNAIHVLYTYEFQAHLYDLCHVMLQHLADTFNRVMTLRWLEPFYIRVGYVFELRFSAGKI